MSVASIFVTVSASSSVIVTFAAFALTLSTAVARSMSPLPAVTSRTFVSTLPEEVTVPAVATALMESEALTLSSAMSPVAAVRSASFAVRSVIVMAPPVATFAMSVASIFVTVSASLSTTSTLAPVRVTPLNSLPALVSLTS